MNKILNTIMILLVFSFTLFVYKYYSSNKNINTKIYNLSNIDQILKEKITDLPVLENDTNNTIVFNDSFENEINNKKKRSFWDLIKN